MTKQFEYDVLIDNNASERERYTTRREARQSKASYKQSGVTNVKIVQRVWELVETKEVR